VLVGRSGWSAMACGNNVAVTLFVGCTHLLLGIAPSWDLDDHVQDRLLLVGVQGHVVEGRDGHAILLNVDSVFEL